MLNHPYFTFCQELYEKWFNNKLEDWCLHEFFELDAMPEPYLLFGKVDDPLYFLTTNPGQVLDFQLRRSGEKDYSIRSRELAHYYRTQLKVKNAKTRIKKVLELKDQLNKTGVVQIEVVPFHSKEFKARDKEIFSTKGFESNLYSKYYSLLQDFIRDKVVINLQGGAPSKNRFYNNNWLKLIKDLLNLNNLELFPLKTKIDGKVTVGVLFDKENHKYVICNQGMNNFPNDEGMKMLSKLMI
jgi:hypothetical protein